MGRMVMCNGRRRFQLVVIESLGLGVGNFDCGGFRSDKYGSGFGCLQNVDSPGKTRRIRGSGTNSGNFGCLEKSS